MLSAKVLRRDSGSLITIPTKATRNIRKGNRENKKK
jgi:hypothetical protein